MKKINKLSLNHLSKNEMEKREMNNIKGGCEGCDCSCQCGCLYEGPQCPSNDNEWGGSSTQDNHNANYNNALFTPYWDTHWS